MILTEIRQFINDELEFVTFGLGEYRLHAPCMRHNIRNIRSDFKTLETFYL